MELEVESDRRTTAVRQTVLILVMEPPVEPETNDSLAAL
jgi:hypothetical protein